MSQTQSTKLLEKLPVILVGGFFLLSSLLTSCMDDANFSTSPDDKLSFSQDSVAFDTVISGTITNTYTFQVYNRTNKALRISQVYIEGGKTSPFKANVDGTFLYGGSASDFELTPGDSLRVFLNVSAPVSGEEAPRKISDKLIFLTESSVRQEVVLLAYGQDVENMRAVTVNTDSSLTSRKPYQIFDSLVVAKGVTLTLTAGTRLYFHAGANLIVHGRIIVEGTREKPVIFRGDRLGNMFSKQPYDRIPGQWGGIVLTQSSYGNELRYADIHSGTFGVRCDSSDVTRSKIKIENSIIHNVSGDALYSRSNQIFASNSQITNAGGNCITLFGGDATFIHCTIANFYSFTGGRGVALSYSNADGASRLPLIRADFFNCLITGYSDDEIMGNQSERYKDDAFNYSFHSCLLDTPEIENEHIVNCLWDNDEYSEFFREKNFYPEFDLDQLIFTFSLNGNSQAVGNADTSVTAIYCPTDIKGNKRLSDGKADIGCYEHQTVSKEGK